MVWESKCNRWTTNRNWRHSNLRKHGFPRYFAVFNPNWYFSGCICFQPSKNLAPISLERYLNCNLSTSIQLTQTLQMNDFFSLQSYVLQLNLRESDIHFNYNDSFTNNYIYTFFSHFGWSAWIPPFVPFQTAQFFIHRE